MKTKWYLIIGFFLIYGVSFFIPFIAICGLKIEDSLSLSASVSASIATFLAVIIVILFFDKYGLHKTVFDKEQEQMFKLIDEISDLRFIGSFEPGGILNFTFSKARLKYFKNADLISDKNILFTKDYWHSLEKIGKIQSSVWTPREIKNKLFDIIPGSLSEVKVFDKDKNIILGFSEKYTFAGLFNDEQITFREYISLCEGLLDEINKWLIKYGGKANDFSF
jgi:hypothetical protein